MSPAAAAPHGPLDGTSDKPSPKQPSRFDTHASVLAMSAWFSPHTRLANCARCGNEKHGGKPFVQHQLSERFLEMARSKPAFPMGVAHAIDRIIPDGWVPLYCPACERAALNAPDQPAVRITAKLDERYLADERAALMEAS